MAEKVYHQSLGAGPPGSSAVLGAVPASTALLPKRSNTAVLREDLGVAAQPAVQLVVGAGKATTIDFLNLLPEHIGPYYILPLLDPITCARCAAVSRKWRSQAHLEPLWRAHCQALWAGKAVRLNHESPWVRAASTINGNTSDVCGALPFPVLNGGASLEEGVPLTWRESYSASLESRGRVALTDYDLVCNDWLITFSDAMIASGYLPPELLSIIYSDEEQLRANFESAAWGRRYTDGIFFRSGGQAHDHRAHWDLIDFGTRVFIPQAGAAGMLEVKRDPVTWQWSLEHELVTMQSLPTTEVQRDGDGPVVLGPDHAPLRARCENAHIRWRHDSESDSDSDEDD